MTSQGLSSSVVFCLVLACLTLFTSAYTIDGDTVYYENQYGKISQTPHTINDFKNFVVINATSYFDSTQSLDFALGFNTSIAKPARAFKWTEDAAHEVPDWCDVSYSRQCDSSNFTYNSSYAWCYSDNGTVMWEHDFENGWPGNATIEWFNWEESCTTTEYWDDWTILQNFNIIQYGGKTWYKVSATFEDNETKQLQVEIDVKEGAKGKYELFIKRSSDTWAEAFQNGNYVLLDPWFNNTWNLRKGINVTDGFNLERESEPTNINVTGLSSLNNCSDARLTWVDNTPIEKQLDFMILQNGANASAGNKYCFVQFIANLTSVANSTHAERNVTNYYFYYGNTTNVSRGDEPDLRGWTKHYNAWVIPTSDGWLQEGTVPHSIFELADNSYLNVNDSITNSTYWNQSVTLGLNRTWEIRARLISNGTNTGSVSSWTTDVPITRRGMNVQGDKVAADHPDGALGALGNWYSNDTSTFKVYRFVVEQNATIFTVYQNGENKTWGSNLTNTLSGVGSIKFGTTWTPAALSIFDIDYFVFLQSGYFPPLNFILGPQEVRAVETFNASQSFDSIAFETVSVDFNLSVSVNQSLFNNVSAKLEWNGANFTSDSSGNVSGLWSHLKTITPPLQAVNNTNVSFTWYYNLTYLNGSILQVNTTATNQSLIWAYNITNFFVPSLVVEGGVFFVHGITNSTGNISVVRIVTISFNGTNETASLNATSYLQNLTAPSVGTSVNLSVNATMNVSFNGSSFLRPAAVAIVNVSPIIIVIVGGADCPGGTYRAINFTYSDSDVPAAVLSADMDATFTVWDVLRSVNQSVNVTSTGQLHVMVCLAPLNTNFSVDSFQLYRNTTFEQRAFFLFNASVTNDSVVNITLYLGNATLVRDTKIFLKDVNGLVIEDAFITAQRFYPGENLFRGVAMVQTDSNGEGQTYLRANDVFYRFQVVSGSGVLLEIFPSGQIICSSSEPQCEVILQLTGGALTEYFRWTAGIAHSCIFDVATNSTVCTVSDTSGVFTFFSLKVSRMGLTRAEIVCEVNTTASSATLICPVTSGDGHYSFTLMATGSNVMLDGGSFNIGPAAGLFPTSALLLGLILMLAFAFGSWLSPSTGIIMAVGGLVVSALVGLIIIDLAGLAAITIVGLVVAWKVRT